MFLLAVCDYSSGASNAISFCYCLFVAVVAFRQTTRFSGVDVAAGVVCSKKKTRQWNRMEN